MRRLDSLQFDVVARAGGGPLDLLRISASVWARPSSTRTAAVDRSRGSADSPPRSERAVKIATWNVNGIRARQVELQELLAGEQPDVLCLQEIKASPEQVPELLVAPDGYWCYWHGGRGYSGVALLVKRALCTAQPAFSHPHFDLEQRIVVADVLGVRLASVYVPNGGKDFEAKMRFLDALVAWAAETRAAGQPLVICGDLNVAREERDVHVKLRKPNQIGTRSGERALLGRLIDDGLVDVGRALDPTNDDLFTWWAPWRNLRQRNIGWRIDYLLAGERAGAATARSAVSRREFGTSDHAPVVVEWETSECDEFVTGRVQRHARAGSVVIYERHEGTSVPELIA